MRKIFYRTMICALLILTAVSSTALFAQRETLAGHDARMQWWREARFGLFLHWGLYAIPAGTWNGQTNYGEWIRNNARIPIGVYDQFVQKFNPTKFNAEEWVRLASPFKNLDWGRCTQKPGAGGTRLFLDVFDWPTDRRLVVPGIFNTVKQAYVLSDPAKAALPVTRREDALAIEVPGIPSQAFCSVVVLDVEGKPDVRQK